MVFLRRMSVGEHAITITFYFSLTFMFCAALTALQGLADADGDAVGVDLSRWVVRRVRSVADDILLPLCRSIHLDIAIEQRTVGQHQRSNPLLHLVRELVQGVIAFTSHIRLQQQRASDLGVAAGRRDEEDAVVVPTVR
jgi:hypothetical protein